MEGKRTVIIGGNWKSNGTVQSSTDLVNNVLNKAEFDASKVQVLAAPIALHIGTVKAIANENIIVSAQDMSATGNGAFTGEISGEALLDFGLKWTILGHSERRTLFGDTNEVVAKKAARAQDLGISAIICCGESLEQREGGTTNDHLKNQLDAVKGSIKDWSSVVIAYEPIWAIGTGKTATPEIAEETHAYIRSWFKENVSEEVANGIRIQYGGSVNGKNASELISQPNIDGFLVGGASLKPDFLDIIAAANKYMA